MNNISNFKNVGMDNVQLSIVKMKQWVESHMSQASGVATAALVIAIISVIMIIVLYGLYFTQPPPVMTVVVPLPKPVDPVVVPVDPVVVPVVPVV